MDVNQSGPVDETDPDDAVVTKPWKRVASLALLGSGVGGLALGLLLGFTRPAGERLQGPLGLLFILFVVASGTLGLVTTVKGTRP